MINCPVQLFLLIFWKGLGDGEVCTEKYRELAQAVLMNPFLKVCTPSTLLSHCALRSWAILLSSLMAQVLFLASCPFPGPTWCSLPRRQSTCACTAAWDNLLLICPTRTPSSSSLPGRPLWSPWNFNLCSASIWTRWWTPSLPSPHAPKHWLISDGN